MALGLCLVLMKAGNFFREWLRDTQGAKSDQSLDCLGHSGVWSCTFLSGHLGSPPLRKAPSRALSLQSVQQGAFLPLLSKERLLVSLPPMASKVSGALFPLTIPTSLGFSLFAHVSPPTTPRFYQHLKAFPSGFLTPSLSCSPTSGLFCAICLLFFFFAEPVTVFVKVLKSAKSVAFKKTKTKTQQHYLSIPESKYENMHTNAQQPILDGGHLCGGQEGGLGSRRKTQGTSKISI